MPEKNKYEEEIDFQKVIKNPVRWFGLVYPFFFAILVVLGYFWVDNLDMVTANSVDAVPKIEPMPIDIEMKKGRVMEGVDVNSVSLPSQELLDKGMELYSSNCASCHGENGLGDGTAGEALDPKPRNFLDKEGWVNGRKISEMYRTLEEGIIENGMAAYEYLPVRDRFAIIHYVRSFDDSFPVDSADELQELDLAYSLSEGKKTSNRIPVKQAIEKLLAESKPGYNDVISIHAYIENNSEMPGAVLFDQITVDKISALFSLYNNNGWRTGVDDLIEVLTASIPENGISSDAVYLGMEEWNTLFTFLNTAFRNDASTIEAETEAGDEN